MFHHILFLLKLFNSHFRLISEILALLMILRVSQLNLLRLLDLHGRNIIEVNVLLLHRIIGGRVVTTHRRRKVAAMELRHFQITCRLGTSIV